MSNNNHLQKINLFTLPKEYNFSEINSKTISKWKKNRSISLQKIRSSFYIKKKISLVNDIYFKPSESSIIKEKEILFIKLLDKNLIIFDQDPVKNKKNICNFLNLFQKKFEIHRRLYRKYDKNLRKVKFSRTLEFHEYCKFCYFLMVSSEQFKNYSYLSTAIKLIDALLSDSLKLICNAPDACKIIFLIKYENKIIENLKNEF